MTAKTLDQLSSDELATLNAQGLIDALGGIAQGEVQPDGFYSKEFAALVKAQPLMPLMIPTPDNWRAPFPYSVTMQVNGMTLKIGGDQLTMVPQVFFEVWQNHVQGEAQLRRHRQVGQQNLGMSKADMPVWGSAAE
jgi:hypothetical protein